MHPSTLKTGDILHCTGKRVISKLIRLATKSQFSHSAIFIEIWGQPYVIDAQKNGVNLKPWDAWVEEYDYTFKVSRKIYPAVEPKTFSMRALEKVGLTAYDFESLLIRQPWKLITGKWKSRGKKEEFKMYCSEYAAWCHDIPKWWEMSPDDLYNYCNNHLLFAEIN